MSALDVHERDRGSAVPVSTVLLFALLVVAIVAVLVGLVFLVSTGNFSFDLIATSAVLAAFVAPIPALVWGGSLRRRAARGAPSTAMAHLGVALLASLSGIPAFPLVYYVTLPAIRRFLDPRFDELGFFFVYALIAALALVIVFPVLGLVLKWSAPHIGMGKLFSGDGNGD